MKFSPKSICNFQGIKEPQTISHTGQNLTISGYSGVLHENTGTRQAGCRLQRQDSYQARRKRC